MLAAFELDFGGLIWRSFGASERTRATRARPSLRRAETGCCLTRLTFVRRANPLSMSVHALTPNAKALLAHLQGGTNVANAPANVGEFAYSTLARAFLSNAQGLCRDDGLSDFQVYGAMYSLRHGLELMLKCVVRNDLMDTTLRVVMTNGHSFEDVCRDLGLKRKGERNLLMHSLCVIRNVLEDRIVHPECHTKNIDTASAERALQFLRKQPDLPRARFGVVWATTAFGHGLNDLWAQAAPTVVAMATDARRHAEERGFDAPLTKAELDPLVELLAALDDGGDGFRYPSSLDGAWYIALPPLSLEAVGTLAAKLESTCTVFESAREECYGMATIGRPSPQYSAQ